MRLTVQADYALRIINLLATQKEKIDAKEISEKTGVSLRFTLKILHSLRQNNIVKSLKGAKGGYILANPPEEISYLEVIETIDGPMQINKCVDEAHTCSNPLVIENNTCQMHEFLFSLNEEIKNKLKNQKFKF